MAFTDRDQLKTLLMEGVGASLREFQLDLERRIAVLLKQKEVFPGYVVVNMAQGISRYIADYITTELWKSGQIERAVERQI